MLKIDVFVRLSRQVHWQQLEKSKSLGCAAQRRRSEVRTFFCCDKYLESGIFSTTFPKTHAVTLAFELWILMQNSSEEVILLDFLGLENHRFLPHGNVAFQSEGFNVHVISSRFKFCGALCQKCYCSLNRWPLRWTPMIGSMANGPRQVWEGKSRTCIRWSTFKRVESTRGMPRKRWSKD